MPTGASTGGVRKWHHPAARRTTPHVAVLQLEGVLTSPNNQFTPRPLLPIRLAAVASFVG